MASRSWRWIAAVLSLDPLATAKTVDTWCRPAQGFGLSRAIAAPKVLTVAPQVPYGRAMPDVTTPVLVVGAGPAGLATSLSLSRHGVPPLLVEKHPGPANPPRAHIVNQGTVETCRDLGIEDRLPDAATPAELMSNNVWATSLAGRELAR